MSNLSFPSWFFKIQVQINRGLDSILLRLVSVVCTLNFQLIISIRISISAWKFLCMFMKKICTYPNKVVYIDEKIAIIVCIILKCRVPRFLWDFSSIFELQSIEFSMHRKIVKINVYKHKNATQENISTHCTLSSACMNFVCTLSVIHINPYWAFKVVTIN